MKKSRLSSAVCAFAAFFATGSSLADAVSGQGTWESTLQGRDLDGNPNTIEAYYDTVLDITWLAHANALAGTSFDDGSQYGSQYGNQLRDGRTSWSSARAWATSLDVHGITGWRLPGVAPVNGASFDTSRTYNGATDTGYAATTTDGTDGGWRDGSGNPVSEMGHMYYVTLGNRGRCDPALPPCTYQSGSLLTNSGPFTRIRLNGYWNATKQTFGSAWSFSFRDGGQHISGTRGAASAWAVHDGDVASLTTPVTVPDVRFENLINWKPLLRDSVEGSPGLEEIIPRVTLKDSDADGIVDQAFMSFDIWTVGTRNLLFSTRQRGINLPVLPCRSPVDFDTDISVKFTNETGDRSNVVVLFRMSCVESGDIEEKIAYKTAVYSADVTRSPAAGGGSWKQVWNADAVSFDNLDWNDDTVEEIMINLAFDQADSTGIRTIILRQSDGTVEADTSYQMIDVQ